MYNPKLHFHFTGIGGSGMSGIAEILVNLGFAVTGSDLNSSESVLRLKKLGATIFQGHSATNVSDSASLLVYSSAIPDDNVELMEAKERKLPVIPRAAVLAELMRLKFGVAVAGSHGKTTTTSLIASVLEKGGLDPTVVIGGQVCSMGSGGKLGKSEYLVAETDESDRSFLLMKPSVAVVTNIDHEHLSAYSSFQELEDSFQQFASSVPFYGLSVLCIDNPNVRDLYKRLEGRKISYGLSPDADIRAENLVFKGNTSAYDVFKGDKKLFNLTLPLPGKHMVSNSLAAIAVGYEFNILPEDIKSSLESFAGVKRRMEVIGQVNGITIMSDYGHHPTEVKASISAVKAGWHNSGGRLHVIFEPHRYSRTSECFAQFLEAFNESDELVITEIYSAGEKALPGITAEALCQAVMHPSKRHIKELDELLVPGFSARLKEGDTILCLGAGSIGNFPQKLLEALPDLLTSSFK